MYMIAVCFGYMLVSGTIKWRGVGYGRIGKRQSAEYS